MRSRTRGDKNINWIETFCLRRGQPMQLTIAEIVALRRMYDEGEKPAFDATLSACIVLLHICGPEYSNEAFPSIEADVFSILSAAGPRLQEVVRREGAVVTCPELGTRYPKAA